MNNRSWMYRNSPEGLRRMNYCNGVQCFINYTLSNLRNINGNGIKCPCKMCKNKKFLDPDVVTMHILEKGFMKRYMCWFTNREPYVPHETMIKNIVGLTSSSSNMYEIIDDNNNSYKNMVMDAMKVN